MFSAITELDKKYLIAMVGAGTFFFGFFAGAVAGFYLLAVHSTLFTGLRTSLNFKSAIFGDGIVLPVANMVVAAFLISQKKRIYKKTVQAALLTGFSITLYFHINQAVNGLVNWSMPTPWHWNILGVWHAIYMFSVTSFLSLFYFIVVRTTKAVKKVPHQAYIVTALLLFFFLLLRLDYLTVTFGNLVLR
jgi:hypothetical protein